jgi:hypothetical protein
VPKYAVIHPRDQHKDDVLIEGDDLELWFTAGWAVLSDSTGPCLAIPCGQGAHIQRVDEQEPAPQEE